MRRFLATESYSDFRGELSLEEEQVLMDEAATDAAEVDKDLGESERVIEVSDSLEDLAVIADGIEEATPAEAALIETAGDLAVAGTDVQPEEVVPAMESYVGRRIATEGIRDTARQIWESIQRWLKQIWEKIEKFFYKLFGVIPGMRKRLAALEKRVDEAAGRKVEEKKITISSGVASLCQDYKPVKNESDFLKAFGHLEKVVEYTYKDNAEHVAKLGRDIAKKIEDFTPENASSSAAGLASMIITARGKAIIAGKSDSSVNRPGFEIKTGEQLLGNVRLLQASYKSTKSEETTIEQLDRHRREGVELAPAREKTGNVPSDFQFEVMSLSSMNDFIKRAGDLLDDLEDFKRGKGWKDVDKARGELESASKKATASMEKMKNGEANEKSAVPYFRAMLNFNQAFARWSQTPAMPVYRHSLTTINAGMSLVQRSLAQYK